MHIFKCTELYVLKVAVNNLMSESTDSFKTLNHSVTENRRVLLGERAYLELFSLVK